MSFHTESYQIVKSAISKDVCRLLAREFQITRDLAYTVNAQNPQYKHPDATQGKFPFADEMVDNSFSWYSPVGFEALSDSLIKDIVKNVVGEAVYPTYSYGRIYYNGAEMKRHVDRSSSEFSVSCCLQTDKNVEWPLGLEDLYGNSINVVQEPGDIIIYKGNDLYHWREEFKGTEHINTFMFYVRENGPKSELKYDTRPLLGMSPQSRTMNSEEQWNKFSTVS